VSGELTVEINGPYNKHFIRLISPLGKELIMIKSNADIESIPMKDMPAGMYFTQVISAEKTIVKSIIKTR
jgi:hypothetical protein